MKTRKRFIALIISACMLLSLCACGKSAPTDPEPQDVPEEYTYAAQYADLPEKLFEDYRPLGLSGGGIFLAGTQKLGENIPEGAKAEYEGQYDLTAPTLAFMDMSGEVLMLDAYTPPEPELDGSDKNSFLYSVGLDRLFDCGDNTLCVLESVYCSWSDGEDALKTEGEESYYLRTLDSTGAELSSAALTIPADEYPRLGEAAMDADGSIVIPTSQRVLVYDKSGNCLHDIEAGDYIYSCARLADGHAAVLSYDTGGMGIKRVDSASGTLEALPLGLPENLFELYDGGGSYDCYFVSGTHLYGCLLEEGSVTEILDLIACGVSPNTFRCFCAQPDGSFGCLTLNDESQLVTLSRVPADSLAPRETLTLATLYADVALHNAVLKFNRAHDDHRIVLKDYSEYNTSDDWEAGSTKLLTEIMAGNIPDILAMDELPYAQFAGKGLLEDLIPYIDVDPEISLDDLFPNVIDALKINGGLYAAVPGFSVQTVVGARSVVGDKSGWSYEDYFAALQKMPEGCEGFSLGIDPDAILNISVGLDLERFVDWSTGKCRFDSEEFIALLNYVASFPPAPSRDYSYTADDSDAARIASGRQMLAIANFVGTNFMLYDYDAMFGGEPVFVGFPSDSGSGSVISMTESYAMSTACRNKSAAWEFLRVFFTEEYQRDCYSLSTNKNAFEYSLAKAMEVDYEKDANGNYLLDENGERIPLSRGQVFDGVSTFHIYATTPRQAEQLRAAIASAKTLYDYDRSIASIVSEGAAPFFAGQKSAADCAKLIQSKANIYVNEQR